MPFPFSRVHATLQSAMLVGPLVHLSASQLVGRSVGQLVGQLVSWSVTNSLTLCFFADFGITAPAQMLR